MKTYEQLSEEDKIKAQQLALNKLLEQIICGEIAFNDKLNNDDLQFRIDTAITKAEDAGTPWFVHEYIMGTCSTELTDMALCDAEDLMYLSDDEQMPVRL